MDVNVNLILAILAVVSIVATWLFVSFWRRTSKGELFDQEQAYRLEKRVTEDMYYDYSTDEVSVVVLNSGLDDTFLISACEP